MAQFRLTAADGTVLDQGEGHASVEGGSVIVSPALGQPLRLRPVDIVEVSEPAPYAVRLRLREGPVLDLWQLGALRSQLLAEIGETRVDDTVSTLLLAGVGKPERFPGASNEVEAEIRLYDDALVVVPQSGIPEQVPYSFIENVGTDPSGYRITVDYGEGTPLVLNRLARRTSEFVEQLQKRTTAARGRTGAFMEALLPGLGSISLRSVAGALRDGLIARRATLDAIEPTVWDSLVAAAALPERVGCVEALGRMGEVGIGFKQMVSVEREGSGGTYRPPETTPVLDRQEAVPSLPGGIGGVVAAGILRDGPPTSLGFDGPFGQFGTLLALQMLGNSGGVSGLFGGPSGGKPHRIQQPQQQEQGTATAASTDYASLGAGGGAPTVLAFAVCLTPGGKLIYEVLNEPDHASYVYQCSPGDVRQLNRALVLIGFRVESIYSDASTAGSKYRQAAERLPYLGRLRSAFLGRAIHTEGWERQLQQLAG